MAELLNKQTGQVTLTGTSVDATPSAYTPSRSILLWSYRGGHTQPDNGAVSGFKVNGTTLRWTRDDSVAGTDPVIEWQLLEFDADVSVQDVSRVGNGTIAISAVDLSRSFILPGGIMSTGTIMNDNDFCRWRFNSTTEVEALLTTANATQTFRAQVVDFQGASVQELTHTVTSFTGTSTDDVIPTTVDTGASIVFASYQTSIPTGDDFLDMLWRVRFVDGDTLRYDREGTVSVSVTFTAFVIEFTDGTVVQSGVHTVADLDTQDDITITAVTMTDCSVHLGAASAMSCMHGTAAVVDDDSRDAFFGVVLLDATTIRVERDGGSGQGQCQLSWYAVSWNVPGGPTQDEGHLTGGLQALRGGMG